MSQMNPLLNQSIQQNLQLNGVQNDNYMQNLTPKVDLTQKPDTFEHESDVPDSENGQKPKKRSALKTAGLILGAAAVIGGIVYAIKRGKTKKLADIEFDKGVASLKKGGEKFTGVIKDTLKNGDKVTLKYKDGIIQESTRKGSNIKIKGIEENIKQIRKVYSTSEKGDKIVQRAINGIKQDPVNVTQKVESIKKLKERLSIIEQGMKEKGKRFVPEKECIKALSKCSEETISALPDGMLKILARNKDMNIAKLETDFTPEGLKILTETGDGRMSLHDYLNIQNEVEAANAAKNISELLGPNFLGQIEA